MTDKLRQNIPYRPEIRQVQSEPPAVRYSSGALLLEESMADGRWCTRYTSAIGQVWPEGHLRPLRWTPQQPADAFVVDADAAALAGGYVWKGLETGPDTSGYRDDDRRALHAAVRLHHPDTGIDVLVHTRLDGGPFLIRWLEIQNLSGEALGLTGVCPAAGMLWSLRYGDLEHRTPRGASPFELGFNRSFEYAQEGDFYFEPLHHGQVRVDGGLSGRSGYGRPAFWVRNAINGETVVCELAWGGNYEFALDCRYAHDPQHYDGERGMYRKAALFFRMGLSGHDPVLRVLAPGETVLTPAVHLAVFRAGTDDIVQAVHEHVRRTVLPAPVPGAHIEIEGNHRGYFPDGETPDRIRDSMDVAAACGAEMFIIDAGWYGREPNQWQANAGDWHPGPWLPNGLQPLVDHAHARGMRFGLWVEIESAGGNSLLREGHPDWLLSRDGQPVCGGRALDLSRGDVAEWVESEIARLITEHHLDMFRIDHNHALKPSGNRACAGRTEDVMWRYYDNLYALLDRLRNRFPHVVFQGCAGGGGRLDWGTMRRFHNTELSDYLRHPRALKAFNNVTLALPPECLTRCFGTEWGGQAGDADIDAQLRLMFLARPTFRGIAPCMRDLTGYLADRISSAVKVFRRHIRPLMPGCRMFHHTPFQPLFEPQLWCVIEYAAPEGERAVAALFRSSAEAPPEYLFRPRGLKPSLHYHVRSDNRGCGFHASGLELMRDGIPVRLDYAGSSELLLLEGRRNGQDVGPAGA